MPRPNRARKLTVEDHLARRIAYERERLEMTYEGLAKRMTDHGCAINQSALYKIEKGVPRRRITVAELVALGAVFKIAVEDLLLPPEAVAHEAYLELLRRFRENWDIKREAELKMGEILRLMQSQAELLNVSSPELLEWLQAWTADVFGDQAGAAADMFISELSRLGTEGV